MHDWGGMSCRLLCTTAMARYTVQLNYPSAARPAANCKRMKVLRKASSIFRAVTNLPAAEAGKEVGDSSITWCSAVSLTLCALFAGGKHPRDS
jgi:hypothetical protein